jgi:hypothetical protein
MEPASTKRLSRPYLGNDAGRRGSPDPFRWLFQIALTIILLPAVFAVLIVGLSAMLLSSGWNAARRAVETLGSWLGLTPRKKLGIFPAQDPFAVETEAGYSEDET